MERAAAGFPAGGLRGAGTAPKSREHRACSRYSRGSASSFAHPRHEVSLPQLLSEVSARRRKGGGAIRSDAVSQVRVGDSDFRNGGHRGRLHFRRPARGAGAQLGAAGDPFGASAAIARRPGPHRSRERDTATRSDRAASELRAPGCGRRRGDGDPATRNGGERPRGCGSEGGRFVAPGGPSGERGVVRRNRRSAGGPAVDSRAA